MGKFTRLALGLLAGVAAGLAAYALFQKRREEKRLVMPGVKAGNIVRLTSGRPPFAEEAEAAEEHP